jgi:membrane protein required for colicin V production
LNWLDLVFLLLFALSVATGIAKGFAKQVVGFLAAILAFLLALWFYGAVGSFLLPYVSHQRVANFLGFMAIVVAVSVLGAVLGKLLSLLLKWAGLSWLDRLLGAVFGVLRGLVFAIALVLALLAFTPKPPPRSVVQSRFAPYVIDAAHACAYLAPREVREAVTESYTKVRDAWDEFLKKVQKDKADRTI